MKVINRFVGDYSFLNNFFPSTIYVEGFSYPTVEHAYQAHKTQDSSIKELIRCAKSPMIAKKLGKAILLPENWSMVKVDLMRKLVKLKFENPILREMLLSTSDLELTQENMWNDKFWGVCKGVGENWLGKILMEVRDEIRAEKLADVVLDNFD